MSYYGFMAVITAFQGREIQLTEEGWEHIREAHPEITNG